MKDYVVVGGGILGLAVARRLARERAGAAVALLEKEEEVAQHQSGRNSGVIHAGLYYRPGSLKARYCLAGRERLVRYARERGIPHEVCGKIVVATSAAEEPWLEALFERGRGHGLAVSWLDRDAVGEREPHVRCRRAILVPETGVIDFPGVCRALAEEARERGVELRLGERVVDVYPGDGHVVVETTRERMRARFVIACAGLQSDRLAATTADPDVRIVPFRGEYYALVPERSHLVRHLVYPVPDPGLPFLGVHLTRGIDGTVHAGPNAVLAGTREGYRWGDVDAGEMAALFAYPGFWRLARRYWRTGAAELWRSVCKRGFVDAVRRMLPAAQPADFVRSPSGVRAQAVTPDGRLVDDFLVRRQGRVLHVLNAPSPAATACLAIAEAIVAGVPSRRAQRAARWPSRRRRRL